MSLKPTINNQRWAGARAAWRSADAIDQVRDAGKGEQFAGGRGLETLAQRPVVHVDPGREPVLVGYQVVLDQHAAVPGAAPVRGRDPERASWAAGHEGADVHDLAPLDVLP